MVTIVKLSGKLCICIDPCDLNRAIKQDHYPTRTIEEVVTRMPRSFLFSTQALVSGTLIQKVPNSAPSIHHLADICLNDCLLD